ncbi:MAG: transglycosylase SLT domain-containing protein [Sorangiineae bacterium]|nr:transglycosylase SLT domain-containing protein [Sorangiineae bacterium]
MSVGALVRRPGFRDLLVGQGVSGLGDWMGTVAFMALALELTGSGSADQPRAEQLETRILGVFPKAERARLAPRSLEDELVRVQALLSAHQDDGAEKAADEVLAGLPPAARNQGLACELELLRAKALAMKREAGRAADALGEHLLRCKGDGDQRARALYLAGRYAARDGRHSLAIQRFEELEKEFPRHRLADDARLLSAISYFELGVEARFTELLSSMPDDFPEGDMVVDGVFRLALRRIEKGDWPGAANLLDRAARLVGPRDSVRGADFSGRERYFRARAWIATGERERGTTELAALVRELPLSYYMLQAWSRLLELEPDLARRVRAEAIASSTDEPFRFEYRPEFDTPGFQRAMELLRQSDLEAAKAEIDALGVAKRGADPALLWGLALLYSRAGSAELSHHVTRGLLSDWPQRWPAGDWVKAWQLAYPRPYHAVVEGEAKKNGVSEALIYAIMREESAFDPRAESPAEAYGLMQLVVPTAKLYAKGLPVSPSALKTPVISITLGARALAKLAGTFENNPLLAIPAYNAGPGRPRRWARGRPNAEFDVWVELIPFRETRRYTKRVLSSRAAYTMLYDPDHAEAALELPLVLAP